MFCIFIHEKKRKSFTTFNGNFVEHGEVEDIYGKEVLRVVTINIKI